MGSTFNFFLKNLSNFREVKSDDFFCICSSKNLRSKASLSLRELNIKGLINVDYTGVLISLRAFKSLKRLDCRNESLCFAIEHARILLPLNTRSRMTDNQP